MSIHLPDIAHGLRKVHGSDGAWLSAKSLFCMQKRCSWICAFTLCWRTVQNFIMRIIYALANKKRAPMKTTFFAVFFSFLPGACPRDQRNSLLLLFEPRRYDACSSLSQIAYTCLPYHAHVCALLLRLFSLSCLSLCVCPSVRVGDEKDSWYCIVKPSQCVF